jgi:hypothetical protein
VVTTESGSVGLTLTGTDPDGDALTYAIVDQPTHGTLSGTAPEVTYTPDAGYTGADSFTFTVSDGEFTSDPATISIDVQPLGCAVGSFQADYFAGLDLSGTPVASRCEAAIDHAWGSDGPTELGLGVDQFAVRWTGAFAFEAGSYTFSATADDGVRLWLDNTLVLDGWVDQAPTTYSDTIAVEAGLHTVVVEYYERWGGASIQVGWQAAPAGGCQPGELLAEYYANTSLVGSPTGTRCEAAIDHAWGGDGPTEQGTGTDNFSVRWSGTLELTADTDYIFSATADDGIQVLVDGAPVIDAWVDQGPTTYTADVPLAAGSRSIEVRYYERWGGAMVQVSWQPSGAPSCASGQWLATYYLNTGLIGTPTDQLCEDAIDHAWGLDAPAGAGVGNDLYSVRWSGTFTFTASDYRFSATADDGIRLWLDGVLVLDGWVQQAPTTYTATVPVAAGAHEVVVEYFEQWGGAMVAVDWQPVAASCPAGELLAEYFANPALAGVPTATRCEATIDHAWGTDGPADTGVGTDNYSVRWSGTIDVVADTSYTFTATADDGIRVLVDGAPVIEQWRDQAPTTYSATVALAAGSHSVVVEYYERWGGALVQVGWQPSGAPACDSGELLAEYFSNTSLAGMPTARRCEAGVAYDWGPAGPSDVGVGTDLFSARWTGEFSLDAAADTTFVVTADDGVRLWVDDALVIDEWRDQAPTSFSVTLALAAGAHSVRLEYYEQWGGATAHVTWYPAGPE